MKNPDQDLLEIWEAELARGGCRITRPRRVILEVIASSERPLTPAEIYDKARARSSGIGLVTVYRTVEKLQALQLVDRVHDLGQCQTIFRGTLGHQHLMVCTRCGHSTYFDGLEIEKEFSAIGRALGFEVTDHWLQLSGLCQDCRKKDKK
jgi:Fe2+ or Zn2+ uptake regulation protein